MGTPAEEMDDQIELEAEETDEVEQTDDVEAVEEEAPKGEESDEEVEIVLEGGDAPRYTQSDVNDIVSRRVARLNRNRDRDGEATTEELAKLRDENRLYKIALEQKRDAGPPKPSDYDDGEFDQAYLKAKAEFDSTARDAEVARKVDEKLRAEEQQRAQREAAHALEGKQREHYARAAKLKVGDYEPTEDVAIDALGQHVVNQLIAKFDDSHVLLYYLGKNPAEAKRIAGLLHDDAMVGVAEIGRLRGSIRVKPKASHAPPPESRLEGAGAHSSDPVLKGARFE